MARRRRLIRGRVTSLAMVLSLVVAACQPTLDADPPAEQPLAAVEVGPRPAPEALGGTARVAVPAEPAGGLPVDDLDVAGGDLLALWGLPLYHLDAQGRAMPGFVERAAVSDDGRRVRLTLRPGRWSDGEAVTADDMAATVAAVREADPAGLDWLVRVEVVDEATVQLELDHPDRRWPRLLVGTGVLPAHVLADHDLADLGNPPEVVGGRFVPTSSEPGLRRVFEAHPDGPLGPPGLDGLEVVVAPSFDTALGLLLDGEVDATVGHLAERPELRVEAVDGEWTVDAAQLEVAAPVGGTEVALRFSRDGVLGADAGLRGSVRDVVDVRHQVEGLGLGRPPPPAFDALSERDEVDDGRPEADEQTLVGLDAALALNAEQDALASTARLIEAQVRGAGGRLRVEAEPSPQDVRRAGDLDAALVIRRRGRQPDVAPQLPDAPELVDGVAQAAPGRVAAEPAWEEAHAQAWEVPLYRARVAHVWGPQLRGMEPSAWPGTGLASAPWWWLDGDV